MPAWRLKTWLRLGRKPEPAPPSAPDSKPGAGAECGVCGTPLPLETLRCVNCGSVRGRPPPPAPTIPGIR